MIWGFLLWAGLTFQIQNIEKLTCDGFVISSTGNLKANFVEPVKLTALSDHLGEFIDIYGVTSKIRFEGCKPQQYYPLFLPPSPTRIISAALQVDSVSNGANTIFDGSTFAQARATATHEFEMDVTDSLGESRPIGVYLRKRKKLVWEFYILTKGSELSNYASGEPAGGAVILEMGTIYLANNVSVDRVVRWTPELNDPAEDRFFDQYYEALEAPVVDDPEPATDEPSADEPAGESLLRMDEPWVKAGRLTYNSDLSQNHIAWKGANLEQGFVFDVGQVPGSSAQITEDSDRFALLAVTHDGRTSVDIED